LRHAALRHLVLRPRAGPAVRAPRRPPARHRDRAV